MAQMHICHLDEELLSRNMEHGNVVLGCLQGKRQRLKFRNTKCALDRSSCQEFRIDPYVITRSRTRENVNLELQTS